MRIHLTIKEIKALLPGSQTALDDSFVVTSLASLEKAGPTDIAFILNRGDLSAFEPLALAVIKNTLAGVVIAEEATISGLPYLVVHDALDAFHVLVKAAERHSAVPFVASVSYPDARVATAAQIGQDVSIGVGAVIERGATIGDGAEIGSLAFVGKGVCIGKGVVLHPGVKILDRCCIGDFSIIHAGTVIGSDGFGYKVTMNGLLKIPQIGIVRIGKHVEIGANCSIDRASFDETSLQDFVKLDNNVHVAHNVIIGASTAVLAQTGIAGSARIGQGCQIGGQVAIKDNVTIGNRARIVSKSAVMHDVADNSTMAGIPAVSFGQWKRTAVVLAKLPDLYKAMQPELDAGEVSTIKPLWKRILRLS